MIFGFWFVVVFLALCKAAYCAYWGSNQGEGLWLWLLALVTNDRWQVRRNTWHVTYDTWHVTYDMYHVTHDMWHMTRATWHIFLFLFSSLSFIPLVFVVLVLVLLFPHVERFGVSLMWDFSLIHAKSQKNRYWIVETNYICDSFFS